MKGVSICYVSEGEGKIPAEGGKKRKASAGERGRAKTTSPTERGGITISALFAKEEEGLPTRSICCGKNRLRQERRRKKEREQVGADSTSGWSFLERVRT